MPHSNFKMRSHIFSSGVGRCSYGQTLDLTSERDMKMKLQMHLKFCSNPPKSFNKIRVPRKACMMREQQLNEAERMRSVHRPWAPATIAESNQEATLYLEELTSALLIQKLFQDHLTGNTSHDYQGFPQPLSICKFPWTTP